VLILLCQHVLTSYTIVDKENRTLLIVPEVSGRDSKHEPVLGDGSAADMDPCVSRIAAICRSLNALEREVEVNRRVRASLAGAELVSHRSSTMARSLKVPRGVCTYFRCRARTIAVRDRSVASISCTTGTRDGWSACPDRYAPMDAINASPILPSTNVRSAIASLIHLTRVSSSDTRFLASRSSRAEDTATGSMKSLHGASGTTHERLPVSGSCWMMMSGTMVLV